MPIAVPKPTPRWESLHYRKWVAEQPCVVCGGMPDWEYCCNAHHEQERGHGKTGGKVSDSRCISLCVVGQNCHGRRHDGYKKHGVWMAGWTLLPLYGKEPESEIRRLNEKYEAQTGREVGG